MKTITVKELRALSSKVRMRIVDVREPREHSGDLGHISQSLLVPLAELASAAERWDRRHPIVLVCHSGSRSALACGMLEKMGFHDVKNLVGGMLAWAAAGYPVDY